MKSLEQQEKEAMLEFAESAEPVCSHCGLPIREWKFGNIDHIKPKSTHPHLRLKPSNFQVLCDDVDYMFYQATKAVPPGELS